MAVALRFGNFFLFDCTHILEQSAKCFQNPQHIANRGERIIRYSNIIRITNIRIRIRPQIETRILFVFVFVQKFGSEYYSYSYSSKNLGPNIIRIRIRLF